MTTHLKFTETEAAVWNRKVSVRNNSDRVQFDKCSSLLSSSQMFVLTTLYRRRKTPLKSHNRLCSLYFHTEEELRAQSSNVYTDITPVFGVNTEKLLKRSPDTDLRQNTCPLTWQTQNPLCDLTHVLWSFLGTVKIYVISCWKRFCSRWACVCVFHFSLYQSVELLLLGTTTCVTSLMMT